MITSLILSLSKEKTSNHLNLNLIVFHRPTTSFKIYILKLRMLLYCLLLSKKGKNTATVGH